MSGFPTLRVRRESALIIGKLCRSRLSLAGGGVSAFAGGMSALVGGGMSVLTGSMSALASDHAFAPLK